MAGRPVLSPLCVLWINRPAPRPLRVDLSRSFRPAPAPGVHPAKNLRGTCARPAQNLRAPCPFPPQSLRQPCPSRRAGGPYGPASPAWLPSPFAALSPVLRALARPGGLLGIIKGVPACQRHAPVDMLIAIYSIHPRICQVKYVTCGHLFPRLWPPSASPFPPSGWYSMYNSMKFAPAACAARFPLPRLAFWRPFWARIRANFHLRPFM